MLDLIRSTIGHWSKRFFTYGLLATITAFALALLFHDSAVTRAQEEPQRTPEATTATFPADAVTLGAIPDTNVGSPTCQNNSTNFRDVNFTVSGLTGTISAVAVSFNASHTFLQDLEVSLRGPGGSPSHLLFAATGTTATAANSCAGSANDLSTANTYTFADTASANWWTTAAANPVPTSTNRTVVTGIGGATNPPATTSLNTTFAATSPNGTWTLRFRDRGVGDTGTVTAASLSITTIGDPGRAVLDFDGDGKSDLAVIRNTGGTFNWFLSQSTAGFVGLGWGSTNDVPVPGDYDGDGKWDVAIWRPGTPGAFYILRSATSTLQALSFGQTGDDPRVTQDYDGDGKADPAVTRNVAGSLAFFIQRSTLGFTGVTFGVAASDLGIRGDFDGDGKADVAVYRTSAGSPANSFFIIRSSNGVVQSQNWGNFNSDYIVPADFDGDGKTDYAVWRGAAPSGNGGWYWLQSSDGTFRSVAFGIAGTDLPTVGDYDGDGKSDQAVWRPGSPGVFYTLRSTAGFGATPFGQSGDQVPGFTLQAR
jgi:subtilisin-like proprotein convertase family protein